MEANNFLEYPSDPSLWSIINPERLIVGNWSHCVTDVTTYNIEAWMNDVLFTKTNRVYHLFKSTQETTYIGNKPALGEGSDNHFNGIIDELRVYDRGLTPEEIQILFYER